MLEDWNLFERGEDAEPRMIFMNTALRGQAPMQEFPQLIAVVFNMYSLWDKAGHSSNRARNLFYELEDRLMKRMIDSGEALYVGRMSMQSRMELYFYANSEPDWEVKLKTCMADFPAFRYYSRIQEDRGWQFYLQELCPTQLEEQWMRNAKISYALHRHGDDVETAREVEHWLHAESERSLEELRSKAVQLGYRVLEAKLDASRSANPYVLQLSKQHALDLHTVNAVTKELFLLAKEAGGTYDGWGSRLKLRLSAKLRAWCVRALKASWFKAAAGTACLIAVSAIIWFLT